MERKDAIITDFEMLKVDKATFKGIRNRKITMICSPEPYRLTMPDIFRVECDDLNEYVYCFCLSQGGKSLEDYSLHDVNCLGYSNPYKFYTDLNAKYGGTNSGTQLHYLMFRRVGNLV